MRGIIMDRKKLIIIGIILIILVGVILVVLTSVKYERVFITPNGTSIEVPANQTKYNGDFEKAKVWNWNNGILVSYNTNEDKNLVKVSQVSFNALNDLVKKGEKEDIDGFAGYVINADELLQIKIFDIIKVNYNGKLYCIPLSNETTHDNILILCKDRGMASHMAKSVEYKNVFPDTDELNDTLSTVKNITNDLESKASDVINNKDINKIKPALEDKADDYINSSDINKIKPALEDKADDLRSKSPIKI